MRDPQLIQGGGLFIQLILALVTLLHLIFLPTASLSLSVSYQLFPEEANKNDASFVSIQKKEENQEKTIFIIPQVNQTKPVELCKGPKLNNSMIGSDVTLQIEFLPELNIDCSEYTEVSNSGYGIYNRSLESYLTVTVDRGEEDDGYDDGKRANITLGKDMDEELLHKFWLKSLRMRTSNKRVVINFPETYRIELSHNVPIEGKGGDTNELWMRNVEIGMMPPSYFYGSCMIFPRYKQLYQMKIVRDLVESQFTTKTLCHSKPGDEFYLSPIYYDNLKLQMFNFTGQFLLEQPFKVGRNPVSIYFSHLNYTRGDYESPEAFFSCQPAPNRGYFQFPIRIDGATTIIFRNVVFNSSSKLEPFYKCMMLNDLALDYWSNLKLELDLEHFFLNANNHPDDLEFGSIQELTKRRVHIKHTRDDLPQNHPEYNMLRGDCLKFPLCYLLLMRNNSLIEAKCRLDSLGEKSIGLSGFLDQSNNKAEQLKQLRINECKPGQTQHGITVPDLGHKLKSKSRISGKLIMMLSILLLIVLVLLGAFGGGFLCESNKTRSQVGATDANQPQSSQSIASQGSTVGNIKSANSVKPTDTGLSSQKESISSAVMKPNSQKRSNRSKRSILNVAPASFSISASKQQQPSSKINLPKSPGSHKGAAKITKVSKSPMSARGKAPPSKSRNPKVV